MIQRPLVVVAAAYLCGICGAKVDKAWFWIFLIFFWIVGTILCIRLREPIFLNRRDRFLFVIPIFFVIGILQFRTQSINCELETNLERKGIIYGTVTDLIQNSKNVQMTLKNAITSDGKRFCGNILVICPNEFSWDKKWIGSRVELSGEYKNFSYATNLGQFDEKEYRKSFGFCMKFVSKKVQMISLGKSKFGQELAALRERLASIYQKLLPEQEAGIILAMLLGEKGFLDNKIKQLYQIGGISHILAISGLHLSLLGMGLFHLIRKLRCNIKFASLLSLGILFLYGYLTGFGVSTKRAFLMIVLSLLASVLGYTNDLPSSLSLSAIIILWKRPMLLFQAGFLLSFGAVVGIVLFSPLINLLQNKNKFLNLICISGAVQLMTLPIILHFFYEFPVYSIILNLIVLPLLSFLAITATLAGLIGSVSIFFATWIIGSSYTILKGYEGLCYLITKFPFPVLTLGKMPVITMISYYIILFGSVFLCYRKKKRGFLSLLLFLFIPICFTKREGLTITFLDVGQGDCTFIEDKDGTTLLIDGGSLSEKQVGTYRILPFLKAKGVGKVDYALLSHADLDHTNGILELLNEGKIKCLILPDTKDTKEVFADMISLAEKKECTILFFGEGSKLKKTSWTIQCLAPKKGEIKSATENDSSMVLRLDYGNVTFWFMADIEKEGEKQLEKQLTIQEKSEISILKVAHHGSKYSTTKEILNQIQPQFSVISCAKKNSYHHPHPELLKRLSEANSQIYQTPNSGAITIYTDGSNVKIVPFCP